MRSAPEEAAVSSGLSAIWLGLIGAGIGHLTGHRTVGAVTGATIGAYSGASFAHLFEDANFFGGQTQAEIDDVKSNVFKVSASSALGALAAGAAGAKMSRKHPTLIALAAAGAGGALAAGVADKAFGADRDQIGTSGCLSAEWGML